MALWKGDSLILNNHLLGGGIPNQKLVVPKRSPPGALKSRRLAWNFARRLLETTSVKL